MMDFIAHLQQLCLQASTTASPIGDNTFIAHLHAGLPSDFNATQSTIAIYLKLHGTVDTNTVNHICAILLDHKVVLENLHLVDSSAIWSTPSSGRRDQNRHDHSLSKTWPKHSHLAMSPLMCPARSISRLSSLTTHLRGQIVPILCHHHLASAFHQG